MRRPLLLSLLLAACSDGGGRESVSTGANSNSAGTLTAPASTGDVTDTGGEPPITTGPSQTGDATSTGEPTGEPMLTGTGGEPKFDVGGETGTTTAAEDGCKKVDFLFVIDNSASMEDNQAALIASFPGFISKIQETLSANSDYHIMVVDSDDDGRCKQPCTKGTADYKEYCAVVTPNACEAALDTCDVTRGAGVVHPVGLFASNVVCPVAGGHRYMLPDQPNLAETFACVATVGTAGNPSERPMNGMTEALGPVLNGLGGCNEGFLRDDALLVITFISDDPNKEDQGNPQAWYDAVVAAKLGNTEGIVVAGLIPQPAMGCGGGGDINGTHWAKFIGLWGDHGIAGSVCEPDYAPFFAQAVGIIDEACDNFQPPG